MCLLRVFTFSFVLADAHQIFPKTTFYHSCNLRQHLCRESSAIGAHIGNESCLIQLLRDAHGVGGGESQS